MNCYICNYDFDQAELIRYVAAEYDGTAEEFEGVRIENEMVCQDCLDIVTE